MSPINPGRLRHRATLQTAERTKDEGGGWTTTWKDVDNVHYNIAWLTGTEQLRAMQTGITQPVRFRRRWRKGVTASMRLVYDERVFDIKSVVNLAERDSTLEILAEEQT